MKREDTKMKTMDVRGNQENKKDRKLSFLLGWALLLAGGLLLAGLNLGDDLLGPILMFLFALCFFVVAIWSKKNWWAIIPGGIFVSIGVVAGLEHFIPHEAYPPTLLNKFSLGVYIWVQLLVLAVTFAVVWLLRKTQPTAWAIYPAAGLFALSALAFALGARFQDVCVGATILVIGVIVLLMVFTQNMLKGKLK
jgi:hypothetical protein